ncbi:flagellin [Desertibaculum subflavum]|uniref:flagellin n=1 Tax=Desertibaculum subflavum TaxID=2268458 RepID=UPI000E67525F
MSSRVGSATQQALLLARIQEVQARLTTSQGQLSDGLRTDKFSGLGVNTTKFLDLTLDLEKTDTYLDNIRVAKDRIKLTDQLLGGINDVTRDLYGVTLATPADYAGLAVSARGNLISFAALANEKDGTRSLMGGTNVSGPAVVIYEPGTGPVADGVTVFGSTAAGATNTGYRYQILATGTDTDTAIQLDESSRVQTQVNLNPAAPATQNAFTMALDALVNLADFTSAANPNPTDAEIVTARDSLRVALNGSTTITGMDALRTQASARATTVDAIESNHNNFKKYVEDSLTSIQGIDTAEIAAQITLDQTRLQASYSALARLNQLTLLDYLR